ncbi:MAG TPA: LamB/YcsF family protein, partial [Pyrinomonadaceae bacterium]|nr:LamB/YcsF family protein [Pyrinomonadaceae bacterium]
RTYQSDGSLTPRTQPDALIDEAVTAIAQVLGMVIAKSVTSTDGSVIPIIADTICIHGDGKNAVAFAKAVRSALLGSGIAINAI